MSAFGRKSYTVEEARRRMERYCAYQERCHQEVAEKLRGMRMIPEAVDAILVHLIQHNFLNEERYALAFAQGKFRQKGWGKIRLRAGLKQKGVSDFLIRKALEAIPEGEYRDRLHELAGKKMESLRQEPPLQKKQKLYQYLYYRGWEQERIMEVLEDL